MLQTQAFNIVLPFSLVRQIDETARKELRNRRELIREAVRIYLAEKEDWNKLYAYGQTRAKNMKVKNEDQVNQIIKKYRRGK